MLSGFNPKKMEAVMKQMGMSQEEIPSSKVIIEKIDGKIIIENPSVSKIKIQGQESFQITGDIHEEELVSEKDIQTIMEKIGCTEINARKALEKTGDLADAILELS